MEIQCCFHDVNIANMYMHIPLKNADQTGMARILLNICIWGAIVQYIWIRRLDVKIMNYEEVFGTNK